MFHDDIHQSRRRTEELVENDLQQRSHIHLEHDWLQFNPKGTQRFSEAVRLFTQDLAVKLVQGVENKLNE